MGSVRRPEAFEFRDNEIVVTIPFDRLDLGSNTQDATQDTTQDVTQETTIETNNENSGSNIRNQIEKQILDYCKRSELILQERKHNDIS